MSRSAGTLITTHNATYVHPRFMSGYRGNVPTMKFDYGDTFDGHSYKYFQDFRNQAMDTSKSNYCKGGYLPTIFTYEPQTAHAGRKIDRARWFNHPNYDLHNVDFDRQTELREFTQKANTHRDYYRDRTGEKHQVPHFIVPGSLADESMSTKTICGLERRVKTGPQGDHPNRPSLCEMGMSAARQAATVVMDASTLPQVPSATKRDRRMRDTIFERR